MLWDGYVFSTQKDDEAEEGNLTWVVRTHVRS